MRFTVVSLSLSLSLSTPEFEDIIFKSSVVVWFGLLDRRGEKQ